MSTKHAVRPVTRDPDAKKRQILSAARRLLVKHGFQNVVLDDVAREAGVAKGTLFLHYKDKDELFAAVFADLVDGLGRELEPLPSLGLAGKDLLLAAARVVLTHFDHSRDFMQFAAHFPGCSSRSCEKLKDKLRANHAAMKAIVRAAAEKAGPVSDPDFAATAFFGLCRSATMRKIMQGHDRPLDRDAELVVGFFLEGAGAGR